MKRLVQQFLILLSPFTKHVYDLRFKCHIILHLYKGAIFTDLIIGIIFEINSMNSFFFSFCSVLGQNHVKPAAKKKYTRSPYPF